MASVTATRVTCPISLLVTISLTLRYYVHAIKLRRLSNHKYDICNFGTVLWLAIYHSDYDAWKRFTHIFCIHCIHDDLIKSYHTIYESWSMGLLPDTQNRGCACAGMSGKFSPSPQVSDPDMHHGTCVTHVPWCMPGSLTSSFFWNRRRGKTFPAFPAHAQPAILRIW